MFEGWYFKLQKDNNVIAFIPGRCNDTAFIQVITHDKSYNYNYPLSEYQKGKIIKIENNEFSRDGIKVNINNIIQANISHYNLTAIKYDIMGPFKYLPMQCRHSVISMRHSLAGIVTIDRQTIDLTGGIGYIEGDSGSSFPKSYLWLQCNDFREKCSIMLSVAEIPFMGSHFTGCICVIIYQDKEYRLATYLGAKIIESDKSKIILKQGNCFLVIDVKNTEGQSLLAPQTGKMTRIIKECLSVGGKFQFYIKGKQIFDLESENVSFEFVE